MNKRIKKVIFLLTHAGSSITQDYTDFNIHNQGEYYENIG